MGSPFASRSQETLPLLSDPGQNFTIRGLTGREFERAQAANVASASLGRMSTLSKTLKRMLEFGAADAEVRRAVRHPLTGFDRHRLAQIGLTGWSYADPLTPERALVNSRTGEVTFSDAEPAADQVVEMRVRAIEDLTDDPLDEIAIAVLKKTKPSLFFETEEQAEAAQKKD